MYANYDRLECRDVRFDVCAEAMIQSHRTSSSDELISIQSFAIVTGGLRNDEILHGNRDVFDTNL